MAKIADKLNKINRDDFTVEFVDNGYIVKVGGRDSEDEWTTTKIICAELDSVIALLQEADTFPKED